MPLCTHRAPFPCRPVAYAVGTLCWGLLPLPLPALAADQGGTETLDTVEIHGHFENAVGMNLARDAADNLTYLAPNRVNLELTQERWPKIRFHATREHAAKL